MPQLTLTQEHKGKSAEARQGDKIVIQLKENPTTGYRWTIEHLDQAILAVQSSDFSLAPGSGIGGGGVRLFVLEAKQTGTTRLQLKLWRDWQGDSTIIERFDVTLDIRS